MIVLIYQLGDEQGALEPLKNMAVAGALFGLKKLAESRQRYI